MERKGPAKAGLFFCPVKSFDYAQDKLISVSRKGVDEGTGGLIKFRIANLELDSSYSASIRGCLLRFGCSFFIYFIVRW